MVTDFQASYYGRPGRREQHLAEVATITEIALRKSQNFKERIWPAAGTTFNYQGHFPGFTELGYPLNFVRFLSDMKVFRSKDTTTVLLLALCKLLQRARHT